MKTFQEFQEAAALALPLAAPIGKAAASASLPIVAGGIKLASDLMKADTAKPRTPNVQRPSGKITAAEKQKRQAREDRRAAAAERNRERAEQGIDALLGTDAERREAAQARANQRTIQRDLRRRATRERMERAAERNNLPEAVSKSDKLTGRLKMLYNLPSDKEKYFKQQNPQKAQGETLKKGNTYLSQIAPMKSNFIGTNMQSLPHMDLRGPGEKMMSVINQKRFYDSDYGKKQGGPPKGP